ncbi:SDR family NAD(P)-dependent oxidoreductase [Streptomyces sp. NPDC048251]|uniref:SDR family NAD(P)-dependent oxidoreductase n=1 Tax=Streptomyces sp. NPDC048251 TaxID=3154501 RepID=UPI003419E750
MRIPDQAGRTALVTGANSGLGLASATALAARGAKVILACRSLERGCLAMDMIQPAAGRGGGVLDLVQLDLADPASVRAAAAHVMKITGGVLHLLMNNAGAAFPTLHRTQHGHELTLATNYIGHAALTCLLWPALSSAPASRVIFVSSVGARWPRSFDPADSHFDRRNYTLEAAYAQSKIALLLFAGELHRRAQAAGVPVVSAAAHPGFSDTTLMHEAGARTTGLSRMLNKMVPSISQPAAQGALPQLFAATAPGVRGGAYYGPNGILGLRGKRPRPTSIPAAARDEHRARQWWETTCDLTKMPFDVAGGASSEQTPHETR